MISAEHKSKLRTLLAHPELATVKSALALVEPLLNTESEWKDFWGYDKDTHIGVYKACYPFKHRAYIALWILGTSPI